MSLADNTDWMKEGWTLKKVLVTATNYERLCADGLKMLRDHGCEVILSDKGRMYTRDEMLETVGDVNGIIAHCEPWDDDLFDKAPALQVIARFGVGYDCINLEAAKRHNVRITNCPGINANAVAEMTVALMMALAREVPYLNSVTKKGVWSRSIFHELPGKTVGILGLGAIGQKVARKLKGFGVELIAYNRTPRPELAEELGVRLVSMEELLSASDFILLHLTVAPETAGIINAEAISKMKDGVYLVNTARAALINEKDVYDALASGRIRGMATDVYSKEPADPSNPFFSLKNFIGTPHSAGETFENYRNTGVATAKAMLDVFEGKEPWHLLV
jgi:D-3-phosphoglycerate dehydrogenase